MENMQPATATQEGKKGSCPTDENGVNPRVNEATSSRRGSGSYLSARTTRSYGYHHEAR